MKEEIRYKIKKGSIARNLFEQVILCWDQIVNRNVTLKVSLDILNI